MAPIIVDSRRTRLSPWVTLVERDVARADGASEIYHSLAVHDYVNVLAITADGLIPVVRQFRITLGRDTLELPGGLCDADEPAIETGARELYEETGWRCSSPLVEVSRLDTDGGRLENRAWGFFATGLEKDSAWQPEPNVECMLLTRGELMNLIASGEFCHAGHVAIIASAMFRGLF